MGKFSLILLFLLGPGFLARTLALPIGFNDAFPITSPNTTVDEFYISRERAPYVFVIYTEKNGPGQNLWVSHSKKSKLAFETPLLLHKTNGSFPMYPSIACNQNYALALWQEESISGIIQLKFAYASLKENSDDILKWSAPLSLLGGANGQNDSFLGLVYAAGPAFHIFFHKKIGRIIQLYATSLSDPRDGRQVAYSLPIAGGSNVRGNFFPSVSHWGNSLYLAWQTKAIESKREILNDEIYYASSANGGKSWNTAKKLTDNVYADFTPYVFTIEGQPAIIYASRPQKSWAIYLKYMYSGEWSKPIQLSHTTSNAFKPAAVLYRNRIKAFWYDYRNGFSSIVMQDFEILDDDNKLLAPERTEKNVAQNDTIFSVIDGAHQESMLILFGKRFGVIWKRIAGQSKRLYMKLPDISAPAITLKSGTHANTSPYWTGKTNGFIYWEKPEDPSGIKGYAYFISEKPDEEPVLLTHSGDITKIEFSNLKEGKNWAHVRVIDNAQNLGPTAHFPLWLDLSGPKMASLISSLPKNTPTSENNPSFAWTLTEKEGVKGFNTELYRENRLFEKKFIQEAKISFTNLKEGKWNFRVQAEDQAGNKGNILEYPLIIFNDRNKPGAPEIFSQNLLDNFYTDTENMLKIKINPQKSVSPYYGVQTSLALEKFSLAEYESHLPEYIITLELKNKSKGLYWLKVKIKYGDGRLSRAAFLPFFHGSETEYMTSIDIIQNEADYTLSFQSKLNLGKSLVTWAGYKKIQDNKIKFKTGRLNVRDTLSYKYFTRGDYILSYALIRPDGKITPFTDFPFLSSSPFVMPENLAQEVTIIDNTWSGLAKLKLLEIVEREEIVPIVDTILKILRGEEVKEVHITIRNFPLWLFFLSLPLTLIIFIIILFLNVLSFRFFLEGLIFKLRWKLGLLRASDF
jgi:hypothetical protein